MNEDFSIRLKKMMLMKGLKGKELANHINVAPATITTYLNGRSEPPFDKLLAICELLKCTPNDLMLDTQAEYLVAEDRASYKRNDEDRLNREVKELQEENRLLSYKLTQVQEKLIALMMEKKK